MTVTPCHYPHQRPAFGPSCTEFVYPGCWHFDIDATSKIDDVLTEHGGLLYNNKEGVFEFLDICKINHTLRNRKDDQRLSQTALGFRNVNLVSQVNANRSAFP